MTSDYVAAVKQVVMAIRKYAASIRKTQKLGPRVNVYSCLKAIYSAGYELPKDRSTWKEQGVNKDNYFSMIIKEAFERLLPRERRCFKRINNKASAWAMVCNNMKRNGVNPKNFKVKLLEMGGVEAVRRMNQRNQI
jgi:hypothetical protein